MKKGGEGVVGRKGDGLKNENPSFQQSSSQDVTLDYVYNHGTSADWFNYTHKGSSSLRRDSVEHTRLISR